MTRVRAGLGLLLVVAALAGACGDSEWEYLQNNDAHVFFKLPNEWATFNENQILGQPALDIRPLERERLISRTWMRGFDGGPEPSPLNTIDPKGPYPRGYAEVRTLTAEERDTVDLSNLRALGLSVGDPIEVMKDQPNGPVEVLDMRDVTFDNGVHGVRLIVATDYESDRIVVVDYTVLVDATTSRLYVFTIGCEERCFFKYQSRIKEIADSWRIEEP